MSATASSASSVKSAVQLGDPLQALADAIGPMLTARGNKKQAPASAVSVQVASALHKVLDAATPQSRSTRLMLMRHLLDVESQASGIAVSGAPAMEDDLISTAQAAEILGYSRPYVAMLIDQNKLEGATVSAGGHRRVSRAAVLAWKASHHVDAKGRAGNMRAEGQKIGAYKSTEADALRRIKALASGR